MHVSGPSTIASAAVENQKKFIDIKIIYVENYEFSFLLLDSKERFKISKGYGDIGIATIFFHRALCCRAIIKVIVK